MCSMHSTLDHAKNEDKHLISQVAVISNHGDTVSLTTNYESRSLDGEHGKHLASVVVNNANLLFTLSLFPCHFPVLIYYIYQLSRFYYSIAEISKISNSDPECTCKCESECKGDTICLCLCNGKDGVSSNTYCICICKKENCLCICICEKASESCASQHTCKNTLIKINLSELQCSISEITTELQYILCFISRLEDQSCSCYCCINGCSESSSCFSYCCCKDGKIDYRPILSKMYWIEYHFKQISGKVGELIKLKNTLSLVSLIATSCKKCCSSRGEKLDPFQKVIAQVFDSIVGFFGFDVQSEDCFKDDIDSVITNIEKAEKYYYLYASRMEDIISFIEYKVFYSKSTRLLSSIEKSIRCLLLSNTNIINDISTGNKTNSPRDLKVVSPDTFNRIKKITFVNILSRIDIYESIFVISKLYTYYKTRNIIDKTLKILDRCVCSPTDKRQFNPDRTGLTLPDSKHVNDNPHLKLALENRIRNEDNKFCLCLVIRYILLTNLYVLIRYNEHMNMDILSTLSRSYKKYSYLITYNINGTKLIMMIIKIMEKIINWMKNVYIGNKIHCFCYDKYSSYYQYLVSVILFVSSLIENIWATDNREIVRAIQSLSNLYSELKSYDFSSIVIRPLRCNKVCGLIVNKKCKEKTPKKCCCWCVACYNLLVSCVSLCIQCRLRNAICKNSEKKCEEWFKKFCTELECECDCLQKKSGCCLVNLALCSQLPNRCEDLLKDCCAACKEQPGGCCKKIKEKLAAGGDLLVIGCKCDSEDEEETEEESEVKGQCVLFENPWGGRSAAIVIFSKCKDTKKCCCLKDVIDKLKGKLGELCGEDCKCEELKQQLQQLCTEPCCGSDCPCKTLTTDLKNICGSDSNCLCKKIKDLGNLCSGNTCLCKKEGCCRCVCCKLAVAGVRILTRACKLNFLEPYKRIIIELLSGSQTKEGIMRSIVNKINSGTLNITYLVKNNYSTHFNTYTDHKNIANSFPSLTVGYGYDSVYEHQVAGNRGYIGTNSIREGYPNIGSGRIVIKNKL